ncbi:MAG: T9SS type A sorting domain-containing protein [candidate division Zixibacteria bacterium]|nr:T9SS type A sorting domain-containing protein [candidate division Zixibacteria bacterium]
MFQNPSSNYRGVAVLSEEDVTTFRALQNATEVYPPRMTDQDKWDFMTAGFVDTAVTSPEDAAYLISTGPITIGNSETKKVVFAYIGGSSLEEIRNHAIAAFDIYWASTAVDDGEYGTLPREVGLSQNYPNPFNAQTSIKFSLPTASHIKLEVYNLMGQVVETLIDGIQPAGINVIRWNAEANSSGIYFYKLSVDDKTITKRMTLLK